MPEIRYVRYDDTWLRDWAAEVRNDLRDGRHALQAHTEQDSDNFTELRLSLVRLQQAVEEMAARRTAFHKFTRWAILISATIASGSPLLFDYLIGLLKR